MGNWGISQNKKTVVLLLLILVGALYMRSEHLRKDGVHLLRYDPYYHYRMAETIVEEGRRPDWDYVASWPTGQPGDRYAPLYHYLLAYTYQVFGRVTGTDVFSWCCYSCVIPIILLVVLAFFVGKEITDTAGGLFTALLFTLAPIAVGRTVIGFADTDGLILVFSLSIALFWIKSLSGPKKLFYAVLAGFCVFLFELTWDGYWHMLLLTVGASFAFVCIHYFTERELDTTQLAVFLLAFLIPHSVYSNLVVEGIILTGAAVLLFAVYYFKKWQQVAALFIAVLGVYFLHSQGLIAIPSLQSSTEVFREWGNIFYPYLGPFISQRQEVTGSYILQTFTTMLVLAPAGMYILLREGNEKNYAVCTFLVLYTVGGVIMSSSGVRFTLLLSVPVVLSSSVGLRYIWNRLRSPPTTRRKVLAVCAVLLLVVPVYITAEKMNYTGRPIGKNWSKTLQWIQENTPEDAVVIADWGYGYWIESIARRKSIMNGGHYDIYWRLLKFGMMLQTEDEDIAVKEVFGFESISEVEGIRTFPEGEKGDAFKEKEMTPFAITGQDAYLIIDSRTALVFDVISSFGTWDYTTGTGDPTSVYGGVYAGTMLQPHWKQYLYDTKEHQVIIYEANSEFHSYILKGNSLLPTSGTVYTLDGKTYFLQREKGFYGTVWYYPDAIMILIPDEALDTMLVRMFFFNGDGLNHFELVAEYGTVKVYRIHRESQENLNEEITVKIDEWRPS